MEQKTHVSEKTTHPCWTSVLEFEASATPLTRRQQSARKQRDELLVTILRKHKLGADTNVGQVSLNLRDMRNITSSGPAKMWFPCGCGEALLCLEFDFTPAEREAYVAMLRDEVLALLRADVRCDAVPPDKASTQMSDSVSDEYVDQLGYVLTSSSSSEEDSDDPAGMDGGYRMMTSGHTLLAASDSDIEVPVAAFSAYNRDWEINELLRFNERFQTALEVLNDGTAKPNDALSASLELIAVSQDFLFSARTYGKIIISERFLPDSNKTIKPLPMGGKIGGIKYVHCGVFYKFALPDEHFITDVEHAMKVAGHELKGCSCYYNAGVSGLSVPLMALIDYKGYRLICIGVLPVDNKTLVSGTPDGGKTIHNSDLVLARKLRRAGRILNLKPHSVKGQMMYSATDLEGHYCPADDRHYLLDFSRVLPPEKPTSQSPKGAIFFRMLRAEFVVKYRKPLSSDAFSGFRDPGSGHADEDDIVKASKDFLWLLPNVALDLSVYMQTRVEDPTENLATLIASLSRLCHAKGINMRYLGLLYKDATTDALRSLLLIEMSARAIKTLLRRKMRAMMEQLTFPLEQPYVVEVVTFLNKVYGDTKVWESSIEPYIQSYFFPTSALQNPKKFKHPSYGGLSSTGVDELNLSATATSKTTNTEEDPTFESQDAYMRIRAFPAGLGLLFTQVCSQLGLNFSARIMTEVTVAVANRETPALLLKRNAFDVSDLRELGERIKHLNVIPQARAHVSVLKGRLAITQSEAHHYFSLAAEHFAEALAGNPCSTALLRGYANVLTEMALFGEEKPSPHQLGKIEEVFQELLYYDQKDAESLGAFGRFLQKIDKPDHAQVYFLRAILHSKSRVWVERYCRLLSSRGQQVEADRFFSVWQDWEDSP